MRGRSQRESVAELLMVLSSVACVCALLRTGPAAARVYYVAPDGKDTNSGSPEHPLLTIQQASNQAGPGDTVIIRPGNYAGFVVESVHATAAEPLIFQGELGARIIQPSPFPERLPLNTATDTYQWIRWPHGITIQRSSYVQIVHLEVTGMPAREYGENGVLLHKGGAGVYAEASSHLTFRGNSLHDNGRWGLFTAFCDDTLVEHNVTSGSIIEHGIYLSNSGDRAVVRENWSSSNSCGGIQINADNDFDNADYRLFADPDGISQHNVIENNVLIGNGRDGGAAINLDGVSDSIVRGNMLIGNHATGIALFQENGLTGSQRNLVSGNWIAMSSDARWAINVLGCTPDMSLADGTCETANTPRLPVWEGLRPIAYASGSTGNTIVGNVIMSASRVNGGIYTDNRSLAHDPQSGRHLVSDFNVVVNRFAINSDDSAFEPEILKAQAWRARTGQDLHSTLMPAESD